MNNVSINKPLLNNFSFINNANYYTYNEGEKFNHSFEYTIRDLTYFYAVPDLMSKFYIDLDKVSYHDDEYISLNITIVTDKNIPLVINMPLKTLKRTDQFHFSSFIKYKINCMILHNEELVDVNNVKFIFDFSFIDSDKYIHLNNTYNDKDLLAFQVKQLTEYIDK